MTHLDAIKGRYATLRGLPGSDTEWLLAQVEALAAALRHITRSAVALGDGNFDITGLALLEAHAALAALEEKG